MQNFEKVIGVLQQNDFIYHHTPIEKSGAG